MHHASIVVVLCCGWTVGSQGLRSKKCVGCGGAPANGLLHHDLHHRSSSPIAGTTRTRPRPGSRPPSRGECSGLCVHSPIALNGTSMEVHQNRPGQCNRCARLSHTDSNTFNRLCQHETNAKRSRRQTYCCMRSRRRSPITGTEPRHQCGTPYP